MGMVIRPNRASGHMYCMYSMVLYAGMVPVVGTVCMVLKILLYSLFWDKDVFAPAVRRPNETDCEHEK